MSKAIELDAIDNINHCLREARAMADVLEVLGSKGAGLYAALGEDTLSCVVGLIGEKIDRASETMAAV